jgi:hypothetical protein
MAVSLTWVLCFWPLILLSPGVNWHRKAPPIAGGVRLISDWTTTRVRLPRFWAGLNCVAVTAILYLLASLVFLLDSLTNSLPFIAGLVTLVGISIVGLTIYLLLRRKAESGLQDLVIHEGARTLELPLTYGRRERILLPFTSVVAVTVKPIRRRKDGWHAVALQLRDGPPQKLTNLMNSQDRAESFAAWLREKLGLKSETPETEYSPLRSSVK